ncbi:MAG: FtsQ-type POTRA domain-containing protein [Puniceicoccaceae bacterium]
MLRKNRKSAPERTNRWSKDSQQLKPVVLSADGRKRFWLTLLRRSSVVWVAVLVAALLAVGLQMWQSWRKIPGLGEKVDWPVLVISGNSSLPDSKIQAMVQPLLTPRLAAVNAFRVKAALERNGQVKRAEVEKDFPNQLNIHITERLPILMLAAMDEENQLSFWAIDESGVVFRPFDLERMKALELPFVEGLDLVRIEDGVTIVPGISRVHYLLQLLERDAYEVYEDIRSVSMLNYNEGEPELGAVIVLKGRKLRQIVFGVENFEYQVVKLLGVLSVAGRVRLSEKNVIDLSYSGDAIVR